MKTIRQELEQDAWQRHTAFAQQQAMKRYRVSRELWPDTPPDTRPGRWLAWKERIFRFLWVALTLTLMVHARSAAAQYAEQDASGAVSGGVPATAMAWVVQITLAIAVLLFAACLLWFSTPARSPRSTPPA